MVRHERRPRPEGAVRGGPGPGDAVAASPVRQCSQSGTSLDDTTPAHPSGTRDGSLVGRPSSGAGCSRSRGSAARRRGVVPALRTARTVAARPAPARAADPRVAAPAGAGRGLVHLPGPCAARARAPPGGREHRLPRRGERPRPLRARPPRHRHLRLGPVPHGGGHRRSARCGHRLFPPAGDRPGPPHGPRRLHLPYAGRVRRPHRGLPRRSAGHHLRHPHPALRRRRPTRPGKCTRVVATPAAEAGCEQGRGGHERDGRRTGENVGRGSDGGVGESEERIRCRNSGQPGRGDGDGRRSTHGTRPRARRARPLCCRVSAGSCRAVRRPGKIGHHLGDAARWRAQQGGHCRTRLAHFVPIFTNTVLFTI